MVGWERGISGATRGGARGNVFDEPGKLVPVPGELEEDMVCASSSTLTDALSRALAGVAAFLTGAWCGGQRCRVASTFWVCLSIVGGVGVTVIFTRVGQARKNGDIGPAATAVRSWLLGRV